MYNIYYEWVFRQWWCLVMVYLVSKWCQWVDSDLASLVLSALRAITTKLRPKKSVDAAIGSKTSCVSLGPQLINLQQRLWWFKVGVALLLFLWKTATRRIRVFTLDCSGESHRGKRVKMSVQCCEVRVPAGQKDQSIPPKWISQCQIDLFCVN